MNRHLFIHSTLPPTHKTRNDCRETRRTKKKDPFNELFLWTTHREWQCLSFFIHLIIVFSFHNYNRFLSSQNNAIRTYQLAIVPSFLPQEPLNSSNYIRTCFGSTFCQALPNDCVYISWDGLLLAGESRGSIVPIIVQRDSRHRAS